MSTMMVVVMAILENVIPGESRGSIPKGIGNPGVEIPVIGRRRIVGDDRRTLGNVVIGEVRLIRVGDGSV